MRRLLLPLFLFFATSHALAQQDIYRIKGFTSPISMNWSGKETTLKNTAPFCVELESHTKTPIPKKVDFASIRYRLKLIDTPGANSEFVARQGNNTIPLEITLSGHGLNEKMQPGQNSRDINGDTFCNGPGTDLNLEVKAMNLINAPAGNYTAQIQVVASNDTFSAASSQNLELNIHIPKLITVHGDRQIALGEFSNKDLVNNAELCVFRNGSGNYNLKAEAIGARQGQFELKKQGGDALLSYQVEVKTRNQSLQKMTPNGWLRNLESSQSIDCREGKNLSVQVRVPKSTAESAYAGSYQGQLKLTVEVQ